MTMEPSDSWLEERLFDRRIVLCRGVLDDALAGRISAQLMALDAIGDSAVELQLDSHGASLEAAWTLLDVIDLLGVPVNIVCAGRVEGAAVGVLSAGTKRTALPHTRFRLTNPELEISGAGERARRSGRPPHSSSQSPARADCPFHGQACSRCRRGLPSRPCPRCDRGRALPARGRDRGGQTDDPLDQ